MRSSERGLLLLVLVAATAAAAVSNGVESTYSNKACETVTTQAPADLGVK